MLSRPSAAVLPLLVLPLVLAQDALPTAPAVLQARATGALNDCYAQGPYMSCVAPYATSTCGKPGDGPSATACACSQVTALFSCYTSACTSDKFYNTYMSGISACNAQGFGGSSPVTAAGAGAGAGAGGGNGGAATGTAGGSAGAASTGKSAGAVAAPPRVGVAALGAAAAAAAVVAAWAV